MESSCGGSGTRGRKGRHWSSELEKEGSEGVCAKVALDAGKSQCGSPWRGPPDLFEGHQEVSMIRAKGASGRAARKSGPLQAFG